MDKKCKICGELFRVKPSHYERRITCSLKCHGINVGNQLRKEKPKKNCECCGEEYTLKAVSQLGRSKYCSAECHIKMLGNARRGKPLTDEHKMKIGNANKGKQPRLGHKFSKEHREKIAKANSGSNCYLWRGGITPINKKVRNGRFYREWRISVFERDDYTCQHCGARSGNGKAVILNADHIKPFSLYPELRFELLNGRTLCEGCHKKTDTFAGKMLSYKI